MTNEKIEYLKLAHMISGSSDIDVVLAVSERIRLYVETGNYSPVEDRKSSLCAFLTNVMIPSRGSGYIKFEPYQFQSDYFSKLLETQNKPVVIASSRNMGLTLCLNLYALFEASTKPDQTILVLSSSLAHAGSQIDQMKQIMYGDGGTLEVTKYSIKFPNGSRIIARTVGPLTMSSILPTHILIDNAEAVSYKALKEFIYNTIREEMLFRTAKIVVQGTPRFTEGPYYELCMNNHPDFVQLRYKWTDHPNRDEKWADVMRQELGPIIFANEHECQFVEGLS
jgi:hypothetical protein